MTRFTRRRSSSQLLAYTAITSFANSSAEEARSRSTSPVPTPAASSHGVYGTMDTSTGPSKSAMQKKAAHKAKTCNGDLALALTSTDPSLVVRTCEQSYAMRGIEGVFNNRSSLNESQQRAVRAAMTRRLTLVQGPPGTGKTSMSIDIIGKWVQGQRMAHGSVGSTDKVFCGSDSNIAVDNLLEGLIKKGINAVRVGRPEGASPHLLKYSVEAEGKRVFETTMERSSGDTQAAKNAKHLSQQGLLKRAQVICATCVGAAVGYLKDFSFCHILIDEASQAHELSCLVPIIHGAEQLVLVGDHCQLPPTISCDAAKEDGLDVSLFDRLVQSGVPTFMLDTQYRMHPKIAEFASDAFYGGKVKNGVPAYERIPPKGIAWPVPETGVLLINVADAREESDGVSKSNQAEANIVSSLVKDVLDAGELTLNDIGIVSPYSAQVRLLRRTLGWARDMARQHNEMQRQVPRQFQHQQQGYGGGGGYGGGYQDPNLIVPVNLEISSVDGFQGREKALIIFSAVRANGNRSVGFLKDWRRCNVAITRAQRGLVVLGNAETLQHDPRSFKPYLDYCLENGFIDGVPASPGSYDKKAVQGLADNYADVKTIKDESGVTQGNDVVGVGTAQVLFEEEQMKMKVKAEQRTQQLPPPPSAISKPPPAAVGGAHMVGVPPAMGTSTSTSSSTSNHSRFRG